MTNKHFPILLQGNFEDKAGILKEAPIDNRGGFLNSCFVNFVESFATQNVVRK